MRLSRSRWIASVVIVALAAAACGGTHRSDLPGAGTTPDCGEIDPATNAHGTEIEPKRRPPGTTVRIFGTTLRGEDGRWAPADRLEAWWNSKRPFDEPVPRHYSFEQLVEVDDMDRCRFSAEFSVPDAEPGTYVVAVFVWEERPSDGYLILPPTDSR